MSASAPAHLAPIIRLRRDDAVPVLVIPAGPGFEDLRDALRASLPERAAEIAGRNCRLDLGDREILLFDLRRLVQLLKDEHGVEVTGLYARPEAIHRYAERELRLRIFALDTREDPTEEITHPVLAPPEDEPGEPPPLVRLAPPPDPGAAPEEPPPLPAARLPASDPRAEVTPRLVPLDARSDPGRRTLTIHRTLRSGASVRFDGDVVVYGDVNPGAQVIASGNVVILGTLKGMAHAGATGDEDAFILAFEFRPTQLRIGRKIAIPPDTGSRPDEPEYARVVDDQIVIDPYRTRNARPERS